MRRHGCDPLAQHEQPSLAHALHAQLEADRVQYLRCQHGEHDMLATASPGMVICRVCRTPGVCLWCGFTLPYGACITVCAKHIGVVQWQARHRQPVQRSDTSHEERSEP